MAVTVVALNTALKTKSLKGYGDMKKIANPVAAHTALSGIALSLTCESLSDIGTA